MNAASKKDFFVSYNRNDQKIAEWIAATLEAKGYSTIIQAWDFRPGGNFVLDMHRAASNTKRTIAVLSPNYLTAEYTQPEWAAAFVQDPTGERRILIPVRVEACELKGLLPAIVYIDLVGVTEAEAKERLLRGVSEEEPARFVRGGFPRLEIPANLPIENKLFVGREQALEDLHVQLQSGELTAISSIKGMGGIGKTELALQYALKHLKSQDYLGGVCWLRAREDIGLQIVQFAREKLGMIAPDDRDLLAQVEWCWTNWQRAATLIVLDDVQAYADIKPFLPKHRDQFRVLLTTRRYLDGSVKNQEIEVLSEADSLELLRGLVSDGRIDQDLETAKQVCEWLGYLPLGLELVGRYLARKKGCSVAKLWERLQEQRLAAKALLEAEAGMTASLGVTAAFELSWQELNEDAQRLAALLSLFALADIPWKLVQQCLPETDEEELEDLRDGQLVNLSLLSFEGGENYQLHQLLREFFGVKQEHQADAEELKRKFYRVMITAAERVDKKPERSLIKESTVTISHLQAAIRLLARPEEALDLASCLHWTAVLYYKQGRYAEAEPIYMQALSIRKQHLGDDHSDVATSLNNLAVLYRLQGRYTEAEPLHVRALSIRKQQLGDDHPDVAQSLCNLGVVYRSQGRDAEAEPLYMQALSIRKQQLGDDHPDVAQNLNNLAELYRSQGRYAEAEPLYMQALSIRKQQLGDDHPHVASTLNNLAGLYESQGRYEDAEPLYVQSLEIWKSQLGDDHPNMATSLNDLAFLYNSQGRYEDAEPLYVQSLKIWQRQLGQNHPHVALSLSNLARLYRAQGRYSDAESLFIQSLSILQNQPSAEQPLTARVMSSLAHLYNLQGHYHKAEILYLQSLPILSTRLKESHDWRQEASENFRSLLQKAIQENRIDELSDHPLTRSLLQQLQTEERETRAVLEE